MPIGLTSWIKPLNEAFVGMVRAQDVKGSDDDGGTLPDACINDGSIVVGKLEASATDVVFGRKTAGAGAGEEIACTSAGRDLLDDADAATQRSTLGLGTIATQAANNVNISGGSITGITDLAIADGGTGQSTAQAACDAITQVSGATDEHVLTKDTATGNAIFKAAAGGAPGGADTYLQYNDDGSFGGLSALTWDDTDFLLGSGAATKLQFRDSAIHIASLTDGHLDLTADTSIDLNSDVYMSGVSPKISTDNNFTIDMVGAIDRTLIVQNSGDGNGNILADGDVTGTTLTVNDADDASTPSNYVGVGTGQDGKFFCTGNDVYLENSTSNADFFLRANDGGTKKTFLEIDADVALLKLGNAAGNITLGETGQSSTFSVYPLTNAKYDLGIVNTNEFNDVFVDGTVQTDALRIDAGGSTSISSGVGTVKMTSASAADNAAWIPINYAGTVYYVPGWTTHAP